MKSIPRLEPGEVHIWCNTFSHDMTALARLESFLAPNELIRAERLRDRSLRHRFVAGRGFLREALAHYLAVEPDHIQLTANEYGKPYLADITGLSSRRPYFNLSHSGELVLLAISDNSELGVDVETVHDAMPFLDMMKMVFSKQEQENLLNLPQHLQREAFFRCWTRKEAYLKGCGLGFTLPATSLTVSLLPDEPLAIAPSLGTNTACSVHWSLIDLAVPYGYCAALAIEGEPPLLRYLS